MQKVLCINKDGKIIISAPWNFEAFCMLSDIDEKSKYGEGIDVISYLFEGTEATDEVILKLSAEELYKMECLIKKWFFSDISLLMSLKKNESGIKKENKGKIRDLYNSLFQAWGILPMEAAKHPPKMIFELLNSKTENEDNSEAVISDDIKELYGL